MIVRTQHELDAAVKRGHVTIEIHQTCAPDPDPRNWITIRSATESEITVSRGAVLLRNDATVTARNDAQVLAGDNAHVQAHDYTHVRLEHAATCTATGYATVDCTASSQAAVTGSAKARAAGEAHVTATGDATVELGGHAHADGYDRAIVTAESGTVTLHDEAQGRVSGNVHITGTNDNSVLLTERAATVTGCRATRLWEQDVRTVRDWCRFHGVTVVDECAHLYKAVDAECRSEFGTARYLPGTTPDVGTGLYVAVSPRECLLYVNYQVVKPARFLRVTVPLKSISFAPQMRGEKLCFSEAIALTISEPLLEVDSLGKEL